VVVVAFADQVADGVGGQEDFAGGVAVPRGGGDELLGDDSEQRERELMADLMLIARGERIEDARNGLRSVIGVASRARDGWFRRR
jgi:hypothetical protein